MNKEACRKSDMELHFRENETESQCSSKAEKYGDTKGTPAGPLMLNLFGNQLYTDVEFAFKKTGECLYAHRVVLAAKCQFFANLLFGESANSVCGMKMRIEISNVSFAVFKDIVNYFYTDDINFPDLASVLDIHSTAKSFTINSLIDLCEQYLDELELTEDNACSTLQISNSKCADNFKNRCINYIKNYAPEVISSPDFEKCSFHTIREISNLQDLNLRSESEMLEAVSRWINVQPDHAKAELRKSLMKCIRFLSFTPQEFHGIIKQYPELLTSGEALDTLIYLNDPTTENMKGLPEWMNKNRRMFSQGHKEEKVKYVGKIEILLTTAPAQNKVERLTSILKLKCIKGDHKIKGITIQLENISNDSNTIAVIVVKAVVIERSHNVFFSKTINSKKAAISFNRIFINSGQTFRLEVEIIACQSCNFFQYDISKNVFNNEHFQCFVASKPKRGKNYFIQELQYEGQTENVPNPLECPPKEKKTRRKKKKKANQNQAAEENTENEKKLMLDGGTSVI